MALYKAITTDAGSTLNYWDYGRIELNTSAPNHADQNANVNFWGYHNVSYYNDKKPAIEKYKSYTATNNIPKLIRNTEAVVENVLAEVEETEVKVAA